MRGVLLVNGLGVNLYSIGTATATLIEVFFTNDTVSFTRNGIALIEGRRAGKNVVSPQYPAHGSHTQDRNSPQSNQTLTTINLAQTFWPFQQ